MNRIALLYLSLLNPVFAAESLTFKKDLADSFHWYPYALMTGILIVMLLIISRYAPKKSQTINGCNIVDKITVHQKTKVYVIDIQGKQFLIADNQNSLAIAPVQGRDL
ncbi:MAG TPA: hypothetical protein PK657_12640 [Legionella sp.]|nr:hypothetical protein [Legionella sp.]